MRQPVTVTRDTAQHLHVQLQPLPGRLRVELPVAGTLKVAEIAGKAAGKVPGESSCRPASTRLTIDTERYQDFATDVAIEGLGKRQTLAPKLVPGWSAVTISSEPAGAQVLVAGEAKGVTPLTPSSWAATTGSSSIARVSSRGKVDIQVKANTPLAIGPVKLGRAGRPARRAQLAGGRERYDRRCLSAVVLRSTSRSVPTCRRSSP